ncbi:hypothetical protein Bbelb_020280 [Branchiostoma belcheri]|nr:hypothetical protein Bbelb_020280 [Branchiostoma belcheri]
MPTCEDCSAPGAQLRQGELSLCKSCSDRRLFPDSEAPSCPSDSGRIKLVFDTCQPSERLRKRQGANKSAAANMSDILRILHSSDLSTLPTFVSATLRIPAVDLEHIDITVCLQELQIMKQEMKLTQASSIDAVRVQAELSSLRREISDLKNERTPSLTINASIRQGHFRCRCVQYSYPDD